jgi:hypothetical protein
VANAGYDSDRLVVRNNNIYSNTKISNYQGRAAGMGIFLGTSNNDATISGNAIFNNNLGVLTDDTGILVKDNEVFGHDTGMVIFGNSSRIENNIVHDNLYWGIDARANIPVIGNIAYNHIDRTSSAGIRTQGVTQNNISYNNSVGIKADNPAIVFDNEIFSNVVGLQGNATFGKVYGNKIYNNTTGLQINNPGEFYNNIVYANTDIGILFQERDVRTHIFNNTVYQPTGDAIRVAGFNTGGQIHNNILMVDSGYAVNIQGSVTPDFRSDYNLIHLTTPAALAGIWGGAQQATLLDWQTAAGQDINSVAADPLFMDIDGADNVLGEQGVPEGNGRDDNFGLRAGSPAIDAANAYYGSFSDGAGRLRTDDPGATNSGIGWGFTVTDTGSSQFI